MNFDQLAPLLHEGSIKKEEVFLDVVYDDEYYPDFLKTFLPTEYTVLRSLVRKYAEIIQPHPTKSLEANYMIEPNIGKEKISEDL